MTTRRSLTRGEIAQASTVFGNSIRLAEVGVHRGKYVFFQLADTAMTPNGDIYFPEQVYKADFSLNVNDAAWLIHELTHRWQFEQGMWVRLRGAMRPPYDYGDLTGSRRALVSFTLEQQASIVADYYYLSRGRNPTRGKGGIGDYRNVIPFLPKAR